MKICLKAFSPWFGPAVLAVVLLAGCMGRNALFPLSEPAVKDTLEHVTTATFDERVLKSDKPVLVDFYAKWCGHCKDLVPVLEAFAQEHPEVRVVEIDVDDSPDLAQRYGVNAMPTLMVVRNGKITSPPTAGAVPKSKLKEMVVCEAADEKGEDERPASLRLATQFTNIVLRIAVNQPSARLLP